MKKLLTLYLCLITLTVSAQEFKSFKINGSIGLATPSSQQQRAGFLFSIEPKYGFTDHFDVGIRLEVAYLKRIIDEQFINMESLQKGASTSYLLTGTYVFSKGRIRPYLTAGVGNYRVYASSYVNPSPQNIYITTAPVSRLGGMLGLGVKVGHIHLSTEYNLVANSTTHTPSFKVYNQNSYLGLKAGINIGGGRM